MECEGFEAEVVGLLYGELTPEQRSAAEAHAASCEPCGKLAAELGEARKAVSVLPRREAPPRELDERIALAARFAAESRDVRNQPLRGGALHVAAASILLGIITVSAFGLGTWVNRPRKISPPDFTTVDPPVVGPRIDVRSTPDPHLVNSTPAPTNDPGAEEAKHDRDAADRLQKYKADALLQLVRDELDLKTHEGANKALTMLDVLIGNAKSGSLPWVLEARLERARAFMVLGRIEEARLEAQGVRDVIAKDHPYDVELKRVDDGAADVIETVGRMR